MVIKASDSIQVALVSWIPLPSNGRILFALNQKISERKKPLRQSSRVVPLRSIEQHLPTPRTPQRRCGGDGREREKGGGSPHGGPAFAGALTFRPAAHQSPAPFGRTGALARRLSCACLLGGVVRFCGVGVKTLRSWLPSS